MKRRKPTEDPASLWNDAAHISLVWSVAFHFCFVAFALFVHRYRWLVLAVMISFLGAAVMSVTWRICKAQALIVGDAVSGRPVAAQDGEADSAHRRPDRKRSTEDRNLASAQLPQEPEHSPQDGSGGCRRWAR